MSLHTLLKTLNYTDDLILSTRTPENVLELDENGNTPAMVYLTHKNINSETLSIITGTDEELDNIINNDGLTPFLIYLSNPHIEPTEDILNQISYMYMTSYIPHSDGINDKNRDGNGILEVYLLNCILNNKTIDTIVFQTIWEILDEEDDECYYATQNLYDLFKKYRTTLEQIDGVKYWIMFFVEEYNNASGPYGGSDDIVILDEDKLDDFENGIVILEEDDDEEIIPDNSNAYDLCID